MSDRLTDFILNEHANPRYSAFLKCGGERGDFNGFVDFIRAARAGWYASDCCDMLEFIENSINDDRVTLIAGKWIFGDL